MKELIKRLCSKNGVSGAESEAALFCRDYLSEFSDAVIDINGNVVASFGDKDADQCVLIDAHLDQIGFIVTFIDDNGFIKASACGGIDRRVLLGKTYKILGKNEITAVPCTLPPHLVKDNNNAVSADNIWFDCGLSKKEAEQNISLGDRIVFANEFMNLQNGRIVSPALDNRAGAAAVLAAVKQLSEKKQNVKIITVLSVKEETNFCGAKTSAYASGASEAIVVDVTFASQPGVSSEESGRLGGGPMIGISPVLDTKLTHKLEKVAIDNNIPYQFEVMGGTTGTNADAISVTKGGIPSTLISIPLRNMHTAGEIIDISDVINTSALIYGYISDKYADKSGDNNGL